MTVKFMSDYPETTLNPIWDTPYATEFTNATMVGSLPVRGEKRLIPVELDMGLTSLVPSDPNTTGDNPTASPNSYEATSYAKQTLTDYITIRIPNRGSLVDYAYTYRFLINPRSVQVARTTTDARAMTRAGWQFGIWGEDTLDITVQGTSAGQYFVDGLTDRWGEFSLSYRNLMELVNLFENNGYFFEGEETNLQWKAPDYSRKRIKSHSDVEMRVGNFVWNGMFSNMTVTHSAETPYQVKFSFGFLAWKERFLPSSPWISTIPNNVYRGHSTEVLEAAKEARAAAAEKQAQANASQVVAGIGSVTNPVVADQLAAIGTKDQLNQIMAGAGSVSNPAVVSSIVAASQPPPAVVAISGASANPLLSGGSGVGSGGFF